MSRPAMEVADIRVKTAEDTVTEHRTALEGSSIKAPAGGVV